MFVPKGAEGKNGLSFVKSTDLCSIADHSNEGQKKEISSQFTFCSVKYMFVCAGPKHMTKVSSDIFHTTFLQMEQFIRKLCSVEAKANQEALC